MGIYDLLRNIAVYIVYPICIIIIAIEIYWYIHIHYIPIDDDDDDDDDYCEFHEPSGGKED